MAAAATGLLSMASFPGPGLWPLGFVAFVPLLMALERATGKRRALLLGWTAGTAGNVAGFYWLVHTVRAFGEMPWVIAVLAWLVLAAANGLAWGFFGLIFSLSRESRWRWLFAPVAFTAVEFLWWTVFPFYFGAGLYKVPLLMQGVELTGVYGASFLFVLTAAGVREALKGRREPALLAAAFLACWTLYGAVRWGSISREIDAARKITVGMVQSNIGAEEKRLRAPGILAVYLQMTRELEGRGVDLILWPETGYPGWVRESDVSSAQVTGPLSTPIVYGAVMVRNPSPNRPAGMEWMYNAAILADSRQRILGSSYKIEMVPFGEYLPFGERYPRLYKLVPAISPLTPGPKPLPLLLTSTSGDLRMGSLICYEDIIPWYVRRVTEETRPNLLVNLTNDSWYGDSIEPTIHMALAAFRAVEERRALVRSTNTGISAIIDPLGRITAHSGQWTRENLVGQVALMPSDRRTVFEVLGGWLGWLCVLVSAGVGITAWKRGRASAA